MFYKNSVLENASNTELLIASALTLCVASTELHAQDISAVQNPPTEIYSDSAPGVVLSVRPAGDVFWTVYARMVDGEILNPVTGEKDKVRLHAYQGDSSNPSRVLQTAQAFGDAACFDFHQQHASTDNVWVQFYPGLRGRN